MIKAQEARTISQNHSQGELRSLLDCIDRAIKTSTNKGRMSATISSHAPHDIVKQAISEVTAHGYIASYDRAQERNAWGNLMPAPGYTIRISW